MNLTDSHCSPETRQSQTTSTLLRVVIVSTIVGSLAIITAAAMASGDVERPMTTTVFAGAGDIAPVVAQYREALGGPDNGGQPGTILPGYREFNWDSVPDEFAAPNFLPGDFFNGTAEPLARGATLSTPGDGVQVSADGDNPTSTPVRFGHINTTYPARFRTFSEERLFSPIGSNIVDLTFTVPGTQTPALVDGFGAVYTDVGTRKTSFRYYDRQGRLLGTFKVPKSQNGLSFLGVKFDSPVIARVRIRYGTARLGPNDSPTKDVAVMDNFIYGEPVAAASVTGE